MNETGYAKSAWKKENIAIATILLVHLAGLPFIAYMPTRFYFLVATPITLLLSCILLLWNHRDWRGTFKIFCGLAIGVGFGIEYIGVQTGYFFGTYSYGSVLGWKIGGVPLIIAINWLTCIYCSGIVARQLLSSKLFFHQYRQIYPTVDSSQTSHEFDDTIYRFPPPMLSVLRVLLGASLMLFLDFFIEPVAMRLEFWYWEDNQIPIWNYGTWFLLSLFLLTFFEFLPFEKSNKVALPLYLTFLFFFVILNFI